MEEKTCEGLDPWEIKAWSTRLGSYPIKVVAHEDRSEMYETNEATVVELENGKYALITEQGCSCYESEDAEIELFPSRIQALESFDKWVKEQR